MKEPLKQLYSKLILERQNDPKGFEKREDAKIKLDAYNSLCGDHFTLYLDRKGPLITNATYHGYGCALSKASTSVLIEGLKGKSLQEAEQFIEFYFSCLENQQANAPEIYTALAMAKNFPGRQQCTVLSWDAVSKFINSNKPNIS